MRKPLFLLLVLCLVFCRSAVAQADSSVIKKPASSSPRQDSTYNSRLGTNGTLMIAGGIGLCGAGSYLMYQGFKIYNAPVVNNDPKDISRNHKQGTVYIAVGGVAIAGGIILTAFGARNQHEFRMRKRLLSLRHGLLDNGNIGLALNF